MILNDTVQRTRIIVFLGGSGDWFDVCVPAQDFRSFFEAPPETRQLRRLVAGWTEPKVKKLKKRERAFFQGSYHPLTLKVTVCSV